MKLKLKHPRLIGSLISILLTVVALQLMLWWIDPWGVRRYLSDLEILNLNFIPSESRGYVLPPGEYQFSRWAATINPDNTRLVPDTSTQATCTIVTVGDSVTFGHGVNDAETWTNLLAQTHSDIHFIDGGYNGYNIQNARMTIESTPADGYLYFMISDDANPMFIPWKYKGVALVSFEGIFNTYLWYATKDPDPSVADYSSFDSELSRLQENNRVEIVGVNGDKVAAHAGVQTVQRWTHPISLADPHANPVGNQEIAHNLEPIIQALQAKVCTGS